MNEYREWLLKTCQFGNPNFTKLMNYLLLYPFTVIIPFDQNRVLDAKALRDGYGLYNGPISVLEVLIALAIRMDREFVGYPGSPNPQIMFWEFLSNLGLTRFDDTHYYSTEQIKVSTIVKRFVNRLYDQNGVGGIFPLHRTDRDQRQLELWSQMNEYIMERYQNGY